MARLIHISDLHFGRTRGELLRPLIGQLNALEADLIAISGDLTQRARSSQFRAARAFLDRLEAPVLVVPGNHDVPLEDLLQRVLFPYRRYRKWIGEDLEPSFENGEMAVLGINTVNPLAWQRGKIGGRAVRRVCHAFGKVDGRVRIVVAHHPLEHRPTDTKALTRGAAQAVDAFAECGADIVLTGHLHSWRAEPFAERVGRRGALQVHAGTGLSTRLRGEENDFNVLTVGPAEVVVERHAAGHGAEAFAPVQRAVFRSGPEGWRAVPGTDAVG
ncbi:MAG TPA: metallophosphoesterase [Paracoccaceae bacterium]|nr:metallophosphoesterase [Paracoccaceae bacterium]